jgi:hypothetical protein
MPKILVLGKGILGKAIKDAFDEIGYCSLCIPTRSLKADFPGINSRFDVIVDCMDLSHDLYPNYSTLQDRIHCLRHKVLSLFKFNEYFYVSTANLYVPSYDTIHEGSSLYSISDKELSPYLTCKLKNEELLASLIEDSLIILRPVALWSYEFAGSKDSFFTDLINSRGSDSLLPLRAGDQNIISFMNYQDAAKVIVFIVSILKRKINICNVTSWQWMSRAALKSRHFCGPDSSQLGRRVSSLHYSKPELPFSFQEFP